MKVLFIGDIGLFGRFESLNEKTKKYFDPIKDYLQEHDFIVGNLETPICSELKPLKGKSASISGLPSSLEVLNYLGINIVGLSNNHIYDFGEEGVHQTKIALEKFNIDYFGLDGKYLDIELNNSKARLLGFCNINTNPLGFKFNHNKGLNIFHYVNAKLELEKAVSSGAYPILFYHSGQEHVNFPSLDDIKISQKFSEEFDYFYCSHHPHVVQGFTYKGNSHFAYSLGNFCFDDVYSSYSSSPLVQMSANNRRGMICSMEFKASKPLSVNYSVIIDKVTEIERQKPDKEVRSFCDQVIDIKEEYDSLRNKMIHEYISQRRQLRNFEWYIKRLNFNSLNIILREKFNKIIYHYFIKRYLLDD